MAYYRDVARPPVGERERIGVLLVNLGTPDFPTYRGVQRYLREFLADRRVIETTRAIWCPLLYFVILPLRPLRTARNYRRIWTDEGSPLAVLSRRLADRVGQHVRQEYGDQVCVELAMSYGQPGMEHGMERLAARNVRRLLVLPLYPQYCSSTTGSVVDRVGRVLRRWRCVPELRTVSDYYREPAYVDAWVSRIESQWAARGERSHLVLAYHGIPLQYVESGDPYRDQAEETTRLITHRLGLSESEYSHCYQSRFGPVEWLKPYTSEKLEELAGRGIRRVTMASPSFAVDCLETLEEIAVGYREQFLGHGGDRLDLVPCLNDDDGHVRLLGDVIRSRLAGWVARA